MGFFSDLKIKRELKKLEEQLEQNPQAGVFLRLSEIYGENNSSLGQAVEYAEQGLGKFPDNKPLKATYDKYYRIQLKNEIDIVEKKVFNFPSATLFIKLSEKYFKYGDYRKSQKYAETCIREYPDKCAPYVVLGKIFHDEGNLDYSKKMYDKAVMLESYNYDALMEYGKLLEKIGDLPQALSMYKKILSFAPGDQEANKKTKLLLTKVKDVPAPPSPETERIAQEEEVPFNVDFGEQKREAAQATARPEVPPLPEGPIPEAGQNPPSAVSAEGKAQEESVMAHLIALLQNFKTIDGVQGSILIDNYGLIIAEDVNNTVDGELLAAVLTNILRTIKQHSGPADLGAFNNGFVETDNMNMHLYSIKDVELVLFSNAQTRLGLLEMKVKKFIDKFLEIETQL
ncbi:roadblock/LC7 domain-containing protein [Planctomycetota bacterium]